MNTNVQQMSLGLLHSKTNSACLKHSLKQRKIKQNSWQ